MNSRDRQVFNGRHPDDNYKMCLGGKIQQQEVVEYGIRELFNSTDIVTVKHYCVKFLLHNI